MAGTCLPSVAHRDLGHLRLDLGENNILSLIARARPHHGLRKLRHPLVDRAVSLFPKACNILCGLTVASSRRNKSTVNSVTDLSYTRPMFLRSQLQIASSVRPPELLAGCPHLMHDYGKFPRDRDPGLVDAGALRNSHAPSLQGRPLFTRRWKRGGGLKEIGANQGVTSLRDAAAGVDFSGLIASRGKPEIGADAPRLSKPTRILNRARVGQSRHSADTRNTHQMTAHGILFGTGDCSAVEYFQLPAD